MLHDITHCKGENCKVKDTCYRYKAHLEAKERKLNFLTYAIQEETVKDESCQIYWPTKK